MMQTIVVLCNSYQEANDVFDIFMDYLNHYEPWEIREVYEKCNGVELEEDLRYLFIYSKFLNVFADNEDTEIVPAPFFLDELNELLESA